MKNLSTLMIDLILKKKNNIGNHDQNTNVTLQEKLVIEDDN